MLRDCASERLHSRATLEGLDTALRQQGLKVYICMCVYMCGVCVGGKHHLHRGIHTHTLLTRIPPPKLHLQVNLLLRLCPLVPYNLMNLLMGLTATRVEDYAIGCFVGASWWCYGVMSVCMYIRGRDGLVPLFCACTPTHAPTNTPI